MTTDQADKIQAISNAAQAHIAALASSAIDTIKALANTAIAAQIGNEQTVKQAVDQAILAAITNKNIPTQ